MKFLPLLLLFIPVSAWSDGEIYLSCKVIQVSASEGSTKIDKRLSKVAKYVGKNDRYGKYTRLRYLAAKNIGATKARPGKLKLKNKALFDLKPVSVFRQHRKNNLTVETSVDGSTATSKFIDREYLILGAGKIDKDNELLLAVTCPVFP